MKLLKFLFVWGKRIPLRFTVVFVSLLIATVLAMGALLTKDDSAKNIADALWNLVGLPKSLDMLGMRVRVFWEGLVVVVILGIVVLVSYNIAAIVSRLLPHPKFQIKLAELEQLAKMQPAGGDPEPHAQHAVAAAASAAQGPSSIGTSAPARGSSGDAGHPRRRPSDFHKIGIILAGGGAKGAYQAGAMRAIYEFLEENNALDKVSMIAGTSIGAWNAMFWLAGLVKPPSEHAMSVHESWWRSISWGRTAAFDNYWPLRGNHLLLSSPWQKSFDHIFVMPELIRKRLARLFAADPPMHFYFTRSNVELGQLEFSTNWSGVFEVPGNLAINGQRRPVVRHGQCYVIDGGDLDAAFTHVKQAVFASMDLPPLMPYMNFTFDRDKWFEDGGVVENLPVWFGTEIEACDLLFILPLNADFAAPVSHNSIVKRMFRVMDVRQGVLERNSLKMVYLYNELADLRSVAARHEPSAVAVQRNHEPVSVFSICPQQPLAIDTSEFWKPKEAAHAFQLMYSETKAELDDNFAVHADPSWIRMTLVSPEGGRTYFDNF